MSDTSRTGNRDNNEEDCLHSSESSTTDSLSLDNIESNETLQQGTNMREDANRPKNIPDMNQFFNKLMYNRPPPSEPSLEIVEQPKQKELRFRYECEGRSAGSLLGVKSSNDQKSYPSVMLTNYNGKAKIVVSLVTKNAPHRNHPNGLVGKTCKNGIFTASIDTCKKKIVSIPHLGIQCAKKKDISTALEERLKLGVDPFRSQQASGVGGMSRTDYDINAVCLCFQAFLPDPVHSDQYTRALPAKVSHPISDKKGASLNISRVDRTTGTVKGGEELYILCDKIQKDNIKVIFFRKTWMAEASFGPTDIHKQVAIVCKTPPYDRPDIQQPVTVQFMLKRISDGEMSDPMEFVYKPIEQDADGIEAKRRKKAPHFKKYFKDNVLPKKEFVAPISQQQQQMSSAASSDIDVKQVLRRMLQRSADSSDEPIDIRHPPCESLQSLESILSSRDLATNPTNPSMLILQPHMACSTVSKYHLPATVTTGPPFNPFSVDPLSNNERLDGQIPTDNFPAGLSSETADPNSDINAGMLHDDPLLDAVLRDVECEILAINMAADRETVSLEELTTLGIFDPRSLDIDEHDLESCLNRPGGEMPDELFPTGSVIDDLYIPYDNSVELSNEDIENMEND